MPKKSGFTLIELLVVISMLGILATFVFINFKTATGDQTLNKAVLEIQTLLKLAQSNATTSTFCYLADGTKKSGSFWSVQFNSKNLQLSCDSLQNTRQTQSLENVEISSFQCSPASLTQCPPTAGDTFNPPFTVSYSPLYGDTNFDGNNCTKNAQTIMVILTNKKNNTNKCFTISKGGAVDVK